MIVTIDGVAASGKSSVASGVARSLGVPYLSSGLLYRAATYAALEAGLPLDGAAGILDELRRVPVRLEPLSAGNLVFRGGQNITAALGTGRIDAGVSSVAVLPQLREWVNTQLRAVPAPFVAEGRDMGSVVFPEAQHKFFLVAAPRVRAQRRVQERLEDLDAIEAALIERDRRDHQQLAPAADALTIDTGSLTLPEVIDLILGHIGRA